MNTSLATVAANFDAHSSAFGWPTGHRLLRVDTWLAALLILVLAGSLVVTTRLISATAPAAALPATTDTVAPADWAQISDILYAAKPSADHAAWFTNQANDLSAALDPSGVLVSMSAGDVSVSPAGLGRAGALAAIGTAGARTIAGTTVSFAKTAGPVGVTEWWVNSPSGLEQGFTIAERPAGAGALRLVLSFGGSLVPTLADSTTLSFGASDGAPVGLTYGGLRVSDATGRDLPAQFLLDGRSLAIMVEDAAAAYPLTIDPTFAEQDYLKASNTDISDNFGYAVAISGDTIVVGAFHEDSNATGVDGDQANNSAPDAGAAYVFVFDGTTLTWNQQAYLKASNTDANDWFGYAVAIGGDTIVVGAALEGSSDSGVSQPGPTIPSNSSDQAGAAYVFTRTLGAWTQEAYLKASNTDAGDLFGSAVAIAGETIVVGGQREDSNATGVNGVDGQANNSAPDAGAAYVFVRSGTWTQQAYLKASNTTAGRWFGYAVGISGDTIVVTARYEATTAALSGAAYVFVFNGTTWSQQGALLKASNAGASDDFGYAVAISGDTIVVGAEFEDSNGVDGQANNSAPDAGAAYVFVRSAGTWTQQAYLKASNTGAGDHFGAAVAVNGNTIIVGARWEDGNATVVDGTDNNSAANAGAAYVFTRSVATWTQQAYLKASNTEANDEFGYAVAISGGTLVVGADGEDLSAGATYVFAVDDSCLTADLGAGGTLTTSPEATPANPFTLSLTTPNAGTVTICLQPVAGTAPSGFSYLGQQVVITAPAATAANPLVLVFQIDASLLAGQNVSDIVVNRNGSVIPNCTAADATPDPCVVSRVLLASGDAQITGRTSSVSTWTFATPNSDTSGPTTGNVAVSLPEGGRLGSTSILVSWSASDNVTSANDLVFHIQRRVVTPYGSGLWNFGAILTEPQISYRVGVWRRFQYRVRSMDAAGNWGEWAESYPVTFLARRAERHFARDGNWIKAHMVGAMNGKVLRSSTPGAVADFAFTGNGVALVAPANASQGTVQVCIDPGTAAQTCKTVNLATFTPIGNRRFVASFALPWGSHVLRMTVVSGTVNLDGAVFSR